jgi:hypothetical protein
MEAHLGCRLGRFGRWREPVAQLLLPGDAIVARRAFAGLQALHFDVTQRGSGEDARKLENSAEIFFPVELTQPGATDQTINGDGWAERRNTK